MDRVCGSGSTSSRRPEGDEPERPAKKPRGGATTPASTSAGALEILGHRPPPAGHSSADNSGALSTLLHRSRDERLQELQALRDAGSRGGPVPGATLPLAGYLLAKRIDGCPVDPDGIAALRRADGAVNDVRAAMPFGRGNVDVDLRETHFESRVRTNAARAAWEDWQDNSFHLLDGDEVDLRIAHAAASRLFGAGNCSEFASSSALFYGARAVADPRPSSEQVHFVEHTSEDHEWVELRPSAPGMPAVVIDPWAEGPAVFAEDGRFSKDGAAVESTGSLDVATAAQAHGHADTLAQSWRELGDYAERQLSKARTEAATDAIEYGEPEADWQPQPVLDHAFAARVLPHLNSDGARNGVQVELQAAGVAIAMGSARVADIATDARRIVDAAKTLAASAATPPHSES